MPAKLFRDTPVPAGVSHFWVTVHTSPAIRRCRLSTFIRVFRPILNVSILPVLISSWSLVVPQLKASQASLRESASFIVMDACLRASFVLHLANGGGSQLPDK